MCEKKNINDILSVLDERHKISLQHVIEILSQNKNIVKEAYLYGSIARLDYKFTSDVDIVVFTYPNVTAKEIRKLRIAATPDDYNLPEVDFHAYYNESSAQNRVYFENIRKDGIKL